MITIFFGDHYIWIIKMIIIFLGDHYIWLFGEFGVRISLSCHSSVQVQCRDPQMYRRIRRFPTGSTGGSANFYL